MKRFAIILFLITRVNIAMKVQRHTYTHHLSKSQSEYSPILSEYVDSQFTPEVHAYDSYAHTEAVFDDPITFKFNELKNDGYQQRSRDYIDEKPYPDVTDYTYYDFMPFTVQNNNYELSKLKVNSLNNMIPSYGSSGGGGILIDTLKPKRQEVHPHITKDSFYGYDFHTHNFPIDDEDIRSSGKAMYDYYSPLLYQIPFDHDSNITGIDTVKDKRYIDKKVIPVHEDIVNDIVTLPPTYLYNTKTSTNKPIDGHDPFFSFVLNDYFEMKPDEDSLSFKGLKSEWGKDFNGDSYRPRLKDTFVEKRRLVTESTTPTYTSINYESIINDPSYQIHHPYSRTQKEKHHILNSLEDENGEALKHFFDIQTTGDKKKSAHSKGYDSIKHNELGVRDVMDSLAHKYGSEDHKKDSYFTQGQNADKGEKKKGFHRVYHKDEFLEDKEFYDNSNSSAHAGDKGSSKVHIGGSEAVLRSQAVGSVENAANANREVGHDVKEDYADLEKGFDKSNIERNELRKYIDVAKQIASINNYGL